MKKEYIITLCVSILVFATIVAVLLMILLPQSSTETTASINEYDAIQKSNYTYKQTNAISFDNLVRQYSVSDTQINNFKSNKQYVPGNSDPFTDNSTSYSTSGSTKGNVSNITSSSNANSTTDKITNSNGGVANPKATNK